MPARGARRAPAGGAPLPSVEAETIDVTVVLLDEGFASTGVAPIEVFGSTGVTWNWLKGAPVHRPFRVTVATVDGRRIQGMCGLGLVSNFSIRDIKKTDVIVLSASGWDAADRLLRSQTLIHWLQKWHKRGAYVAAVCSAVAFLAESGLLDGRLATTHWGLASIFRERYPNARWQTDRRITEDERVLCGGGVYAAVDLSLYLVEKFCGRETARETAKALCVGMPRTRQTG
ncbi:MAG: hypothetical protein GC202_00355 [Alphaproteobacteria bacterium]|nr:hypothetical protein [Alphaproteobacteria bacterium]